MFQNLLRQKLIFVTSLLFVFVLINSCKRTDLQKPVSNEFVESRFFNLPSNAGPELKAVAEKIRTLNNKHQFLGKFVKQNGYPVWDKVISNETGVAQTRQSQRTSSTDTTTFFIPFEMPSSEVQSYLVCSKVDTSYNFRLYRKDVLDNAVTTDTTKKKFLKSAVSLFALFEKTINQKDSLLINGIYQKYFSQVNLSFNSSGEASGRTSLYLYTVQVCYRVYCGPGPGSGGGGGDDPPPSGGGGGIARTNTLPGDCYNCNTYWHFSWSGNSGEQGWWEPESSGGGNPNFNDPGEAIRDYLMSKLQLGIVDMEWFDLSPNNQVREIELYNFLTSTTLTEDKARSVALEHYYKMQNDPNYLAFVEGQTGQSIVDEHGFLYVRLYNLKQQLLANKDYLIPCNFLQHFQNISTFVPPAAITNRLVQLNQDYQANSVNINPYYFDPTIFTPSQYGFALQTLSSAQGSTVNMDYFPIHITQLPSMNGTQMTPSQLFEYFRLNINTLINTNIARFDPYNDGVTNDTQLWNSYSPFSSMLHLNMIKNGTVIVSDFYASTNSASFTVSTLVSPLDGSHPLGGTRKWAIVADPNGGYNFYVTAVDRVITDELELADRIWDAIGGTSGFEAADGLWRSLQTKMINFISSQPQGGSANLYPGNEVIARPQWNDVSDYCLGKISEQEMRVRMNCP